MRYNGCREKSGNLNNVQDREVRQNHNQDHGWTPEGGKNTPRLKNVIMKQDQGWARS